MTDLMFGEFAKYQVLPLDASVATRARRRRVRALIAGRSVFTYSGEQVDRHSAVDRADLLNTSYTITAEIDVPQGRRRRHDCHPGRPLRRLRALSGKGKPIFTWNLLDLKRVKWQGADALSPGKHTIVYDFKYDGLGFATLAFNN